MGKLQMQIAAARKRAREREKDNDIERLSRVFNDEENPTFVWQLDFAEVFHRSEKSKPGKDLLETKELQKPGGFDLILANPPYVSIETFARTTLQDELKRKFKTYASRCDIYCFFYELGLALLRDGGVLTFISSNKFQRAGYGKGLRQLLAAQRIRALIDFCELPVFAAATDPMIVIASKAVANANHQFPVLVVKDESEFGSLKQSLDSRGSFYKTEQLKVEGWSLEGGQGLAIVEKLRSNGTPLVNYVSGKLYRGIITGLNEAFVIDQATRDQLIREDRKSAELIKSLSVNKVFVVKTSGFIGVSASEFYLRTSSKQWIRGRDITRWTHEYRNLYIIIVRYDFHSELKKYPAILRHLTKFEKALKARGQCQTSRSGESEGQHHWLELDNNPSEDYIAAFGEPKIVFSDIGKLLKATFDTSGRVIGNTGYIITNPDGALLPILLSSVTDWYARSTFQTLGDPWNGGRMRFIYQNMKHVPIPAANAADKSRLAKLAERAVELAAAGGGKALVKVEREIDEIVYRLFDLNSEEITHIENSLANTRKNTSKDDDSDDDE
jgi:hypothetical protein